MDPVYGGQCHFGRAERARMTIVQFSSWWGWRVKNYISQNTVTPGWGLVRNLESATYFNWAHPLVFDRTIIALQTS